MAYYWTFIKNACQKHYIGVDGYFGHTGSSPILVKNGLATTTLAESKICNKATDARKYWIFNTSQTGTGSTKVAFHQNWRRTSLSEIYSLVW